MVIGMLPNTLKETQKLSVWVRQTISFSTAMNTKKQAQRKDSLNQPASVS